MAEWVWLAAGVLVGAAAAGVLVDLRWRSRAPRGKLEATSQWRFAGLRDPTLVVRDLQGVDVPPGTRVLASGLVDPAVQQTCVVRQVDTVPAEYALDATRTHALLLVGGAQPGSLALATSDPVLVERLGREAALLWERARPYAQHLSVASLAGRTGIAVETTGRIQEGVPYQSRYLARLEDNGAAVGLLVDRDPTPLQGERVQVRGRLVKDDKGYTAIEATDIRRLR